MFRNGNRDLGEVARQDTDALINSLLSAYEGQIFITSFCGESGDSYTNENGLLSQWRAYGAGGGFAIILDTESLEKAIIQTEFPRFAYGYASLADVVYSNNEGKYKEELSSAFLSVVSYVDSMLCRMLQIQMEDLMEAAYSEFLSCVSRYKHRGFSEENEVRIITHALTDTFIGEGEKRKKKTIYFRDGDGIKIPYLKLFDYDKSLLPIEKIIIGPQQRADQKKAFLDTFLIGQDIEVTISDIPYSG